MNTRQMYLFPLILSVFSSILYLLLFKITNPEEYLNLVLAASTVLIWSAIILFFEQGRYAVILIYSFFAVLLNLFFCKFIVKKPIRELLSYRSIVLVIALITAFIILFILFNKKKKDLGFIFWGLNR